MYQDLSFMKVPLPEDVLKLKTYGDYAGSQKMIRYFLEHKDIPRRCADVWRSSRKSSALWVLMNILILMQRHWTLWPAICVIFKEEELRYLKEISAADWIYIDGEVHFQRRFYENLIKTRPDLAARVMVEDVDDARGNALETEAAQ